MTSDERIAQLQAELEVCQAREASPLFGPVAIFALILLAVVCYMAGANSECHHIAAQELNDGR